MEGGKPAGVACIHLDAEYRCGLFGKPERPAVCLAFQAEIETCGATRTQAIEVLSSMEMATRNDH